MVKRTYNTTIAYCKPVGHPEYMVVEHNDIYEWSCNSLCVVTDEAMNEDRSLTQSPYHQPQSIEWRRLAMNFPAGVPRGGIANGRKPRDRDNAFDGRNDHYYSANTNDPVTCSVVGTPSVIAIPGVAYALAVMATNVPGRVTAGE